MRACSNNYSNMTGCGGIRTLRSRNCLRRTDNMSALLYKYKHMKCRWNGSRQGNDLLKYLALEHLLYVLDDVRYAPWHRRRKMADFGKPLSVFSCRRWFSGPWWWWSWFGMCFNSCHQRTVSFHMTCFHSAGFSLNKSKLYFLKTRLTWSQLANVTVSDDVANRVNLYVFGAAKRANITH